MTGRPEPLDRAERMRRMRVRIDVPVELPPPFNTEAHPDSMRHYAHGFGDPNPLFSDPAYGNATRWGSMIAAPLYLTTLKASDAGPMPEDVRTNSKGAFAGMGAYYGGSTWEFYQPIQPGDSVRVDERLIDVQEQDSASYGQPVIRADTKASYFRRSDGVAVADHTWRFFHVERSARHGSSSHSHNGDAHATTYTPAEIDELERAILSERPRGSNPLSVAAISIGDTIPGVTKGPMRVSDVLSWRIGNGPGSTGWGAFRLMSMTRERIPAFFTRNPVGAWDIVQRLHWENEWAAQVGQPRPFDEGPMREAWLAHAVTDWMGDDAQLLRLDTRLSGFNYVGDVTRISGRVTDVNQLGIVQLSLSGVNQGGQETCSAQAVVQLSAEDR